MRGPRILLTLILAVAGLVACSKGSTDVSGISGASSGPSGPTAVSGPTGATSVTGIGGDFAGPVSVELPGDTSGLQIDRALFSCDGVLGTWRYIFQGDFGSGIVFDIDSTVDLSSGAGTLIFGDSIEVPQVGSFTFEDTIDIEVGGMADAPTLRVTNAKTKVTGSIPFPVDVLNFFTKDLELPVVAGSDRC